MTRWPVIVMDPEEMEKKGIEYVVINNTTTNEDSERLREELESRHEKVAEFNPYKKEGFRVPYDRTALTCVPVGTKELFSREKPGPHLIIYKLKTRK